MKYNLAKIFARSVFRIIPLLGIIVLLVVSPPLDAAPVITEYPGLNPDFGSYITNGPDGNLWFTEYSHNNIGKVTPAGLITKYTSPTPNSSPFMITTGPDGNLWFTEYQANKIGKITPDGTIIEYPVPTANSNPSGITVGPDDNLWFTEFTTDKIGRLTPDGTFTEFPLPDSVSNPNFITAGPDGNLWFTEYANSHSRIGKITPEGVITEYPVTEKPNCNLTGIATGSDGNLWFTEVVCPNSDKYVGRITPAGVITLFPYNSSYSITQGPDGNLWFAEASLNKIARITADGTLTEYPVPTTNSFPYSIIAGPDGNLWFTEPGSRQIGKLELEAGPLMVTYPSDNGRGLVAGTFSYALKVAKTNQTINFKLYSGNTIAVKAALPPVQPGATISAPCTARKPTIILDGSTLPRTSKIDGLHLLGNNTLSGLKIIHFPGKPLYATGHGNHLSCDVLQH